MKYLISLMIMAVFLIPQISYSENASKVEIERALRMTQDMLKNPDSRKTRAEKSSDGIAADAKVKDIAGSAENEQAIYELAASVFGSLMEQSGGDMEKMQKMLSDGLQNPEAFANKWSPDQLQKLNSIATKANPGVGPSKVITRPLKR